MTDKKAVFSCFKVEVDSRFVKNFNLERLFNLVLRSMTLACKFLLVFFLARFLTPSALGLFGLLTATISYALYLLGFDFYTFSTRELLKFSKNQWGGMLKSQIVFTVVLYCLLCPILILLFTFGALPWAIAYWFFVLLVLEHINQELMRLLVAISKPLMAGWVLFLRAGSWTLVVAGLMLVAPRFRNLEVVLLCWTIGSLWAAISAVKHLHGIGMGGWRKHVDWAWIGKGVRVALPLLVATLAIRGLFTLDRYWLEALAGLDVLGAYVLFMGIGNAIMSFLDAGVFAFIYPNLIVAYQKGQADVFRNNVKRLLLQTLTFTVVSIAIALVLVDPLLGWLGKPIFREQEGIFVWILLAIFLYALGMVPHYALYAQGRDGPLIRSHVVSLFAFITATWLASGCWPQIAVPLGLCVAFLLILLWKVHAYFRLTPIPYRSF